MSLSCCCCSSSVVNVLSNMVHFDLHGVKYLFILHASSNNFEFGIMTRHSFEFITSKSFCHNRMWPLGSQFLKSGDLHQIKHKNGRPRTIFEVRPGPGEQSSFSKQMPLQLAAQYLCGAGCHATSQHDQASSTYRSCRCVQSI